MEFRILGALEVVQDGRAIRLDRQRTRALLAYLLLHANEPVSSDRVVDDLWGPEPPKTAGASLQNYVSRLRKSLGSDALLSTPAGYTLRVDPERFDLTRFERLVEEARDADAPERSEKLRAALALWRGAPLGDLAYEPFAQGEIARLEELRLAALEQRIAADLELGRGVELLPELEQLVGEHPARERLRAQLMLALYRAGRQTDALAAYRDVRQVLRDELGLEPGEQLRRLEQAILRHDVALDSGTDAAPESIESRRTVTVLFCDLVHSTPLATEHDPEALRRLLLRYFEAASAAIARHGGTTEKFIGDAVMAVFGAPELHEDDALRAVRAAVDARAAVAELGAGFEVRIAVNSGEVLSVPAPGRALHVTGAAVNVAAHLEAGASPGEIVLGDETCALLGGAVRVEPVELGDGLRGWRLVELVPDVPAVVRLLDAPLIGRDGELRRLRAAFDHARAEKRCRVATILGEAGIGKTRLAKELAALLSNEARLLVGRCVSYGEGATYLPLAEIVAAAAPEPSVAGVRALLQAEEDADPVADRVAELVGLTDAPGAPGEAFWAVRRLFEALSRDSPLLVVFEDVHWAEPTLLDLVEYLGEWAAGPILLVCAARPDLLEQRPGWAGPTSTGFVVELGPLPDHDVGTLVDGLSTDRVLGSRALRSIVDRAGGNPLFAEQLLALAEEAPGERPPASIEALLASRLDRLKAEQLSVLRRASVVGREFALAELLDAAPADDRALRGLVRRRLIHRGENGTFRFHHALVREVAYRGIPKADRADLHERLADRLGTSAPDEHLGYHLEHAFLCHADLGGVDERVRTIALRGGAALGRAGIRAWKRGDAPAATNLQGRATRLLPAEDPTRLELLCELGVAVWATGDLGGAEDVLTDAIGAAAAARDDRLELRARLELANLRLFREPETADYLLEVASRAIPVFDEAGDERSLGRAWLITAYVRGGLHCRYAESEEAALRAVEHARHAGWAPVASLEQAAAALFYGPTPAREAIERCRTLLADAGRGGRANVLVFLAGLEAMRDHFAEALRLVDEARWLHDELGLAVHAATNVSTVLADIEVLRRDLPAAERVLRESCGLLQRIGDRVHLATQAAQLAAVLAARHQDDEAAKWTRVARDCAVTQDVNAQLLWRAAEATVLARRGALDEAEALVAEAAELGERTDALNHRAAVALAHVEVLRQAGRIEEATAAVEAALSLFEQKGNLVAVRRGRALLGRLART